MQPKVIHKILRVVNLDVIQPKVIHKILRVVNLDANSLRLYTKYLE